MQDELETKFGLTFTVINRDYLALLRRDRGYSANPWSSGTRFIISHSLMADETYMGGLRDLLGMNWPVIEALAKALLQKGKLTEAEVVAIIDGNVATGLHA